MTELVTDVLKYEYESIIADIGVDANDQWIIDRLVQDADWTDRGAREVLGLARKFGTSILRNALALASAMKIEDGSSGL